MKQFFNRSISLMMMASLMIMPHQYAHATQNKEDFNAACADPLRRLENASDKAAAKAGDQALATCVKADIARRTKNFETTKSVVYATAVAVCTALAIWEDIPYTAAEVKAICSGTAIGASVAGIGIDIAGKAIINKHKKKYGEETDKVFSADTLTPLLGIGMSLGTQALMSSSASQVGTTATTGSSSASRIGCAMSAMGLAIPMTTSIIASDQSKKLQKKMVSQAAEQQKVTNSSVSKINGQTSFNTGHGGGSGASDSSTMDYADIPNTDTCQNKSGPEYLKCMGSLSPEMSAITNSAFLGAMDKVMPGKSYADYLKNYDGEQDLAQYVAKGLGYNPAFVSQALKNAETIGKKMGAEETYTPMTYTRNSGSKPSVGADMDFSKLMGDMMSKLNPEAAKDGKADASELVFRQMDLLPPEKIEQNKEISLFARIAFRYRKNANNVEQLNWSGQQNQNPK